MFQQDDRAVDAIWKTELESANEKLVLYHLASKHELGDRYSSHWKAVEQFLSDFDKRWSSFKDIVKATQLSEVKLQRTLDNLLKKSYIELQPETGNQLNYAITKKIFEDFRKVLRKSA